MRNLKKLLSDPGKAKRQRRINLNIQITILSWLVEFLSFFVVFLGAFILGNKNSKVTLALQTLTAFCYLIVVPSMYLVKSSKFKTRVLDSKIYLALNVICCFPLNDDQNEKVDKQNDDDNEREVGAKNDNDSGQRVDDQNNDVNEDEESGDLQQCQREYNRLDKNATKDSTRKQERKVTSEPLGIVDLEVPIE